MVLSSRSFLPFRSFSLIFRSLNPSSAFALRLYTMLWLVNVVWAVAISPLFNQVNASPFPHIRQLEQQSDTTGAVASESDICSHIGIDLLRMGGNAADAVSTLCL